MVKLADIAKKTGYSINTVSHALNDKPDIADTTKEYICRVADEMGYVRNYSASSLRSGKTHSIAIIISDISNPIFAIVVKEIEQTLREKGYNAFIINTDEDEKIEREAIISAVSKCVDGILICPTQKSTSNIELMIEKNVPFVLFGRYFDNINTNYVMYDDLDGGYQAGKYLLQSGHKDILFINAHPYISSARLRLDGIIKAYKETDIDISHLKVIEADATGDSHTIEKIVADNGNCSAIICFSDFFALEVAYVLSKSGKKIPEDVSIMGFDDISSKLMFPISITSVAPKAEKITLKAVDVLLKLIDKSRDNFKIALPVTVKERNSTAKK